jgi:hypothetical protein
MSTARFRQVIVGAALIVAVVMALQPFNSAGGKKEAVRSYVGMGDVHVADAQSSIPGTGAVTSSRSRVGMGDLHVYEAQVAAEDAAAATGDRRSPGMGDLHRFEALQEK